MQKLAGFTTYPQEFARLEISSGKCFRVPYVGFGGCTKMKRCRLLLSFLCRHFCSPFVSRFPFYLAVVGLDLMVQPALQEELTCRVCLVPSESPNAFRISVRQGSHLHFDAEPERTNSPDVNPAIKRPPCTSPAFDERFWKSRSAQKSNLSMFAFVNFIGGPSRTSSPRISRLPNLPATMNLLPRLRVPSHNAFAV